MDKNLTITEKVEKLIDFFASGEVSCEFCLARNPKFARTKEVFLPDVLDKIHKQNKFLLYHSTKAESDLLYLWFNCGDKEKSGIKKSLNELFARKKIENDCDEVGEYPTWERFEFKNQNIQNLAEFLWELFSKQIQDE